jgi:hypothetical protein
MVALLAGLANASTWFIAPGGADTNPGTRAQPFATLSRGVTALGSGDELVLLPGRWTGQLRNPPSGSVGRPTVIRADVPGTVVIDAAGGAGLVYPEAALDLGAGHDFITVEGLTFTRGGGTVVNLAGDSLVLRQVGAFDADDTRSYPSVIGVDGADVLLEDVWAFGGGRQLIGLYGPRPTLRRVVVRWDRYRNGGNPASGIELQAVDAHLENVIGLDFAAPPVAGRAYGAFFFHGGADRALVEGSILLNVQGFQTALYLADSPQQGSVRDTVVWSCSGVGVQFGNGGLAEQMTLGGVDLAAYSSTNASLTGSVVVDAGAVVGVSSSSNLFFGAPVPATATDSLVVDPQLRYLVRVEDGTPGKGSAPGGRDRGATILRRVIDGGTTPEPLWPWPHEGRIRSEMCATTTRGWCGTSKTLTQYIWEFLGAPTPDFVLDGGVRPGDPDAGTDAGAGSLEDGGSLHGARSLRVGCGCDGASSLAALHVSALAAWFLSRRRPRAR